MFLFNRPIASPFIPPAQNRKRSRSLVIVNFPAPFCSKKDGEDDDEDDDASARLQAFQNQLNAKNGDVQALAMQLFQEQYKGREQRRKLNLRIAELEGRAPGEGSIVLSGDDAKLFTEILNGRKLADVKKALDDGATQTGELADLKFRSMVTDAAAAHNLKPSVLQELAKSRSLNLEMGEVEHEVDKNGKKEKARKPAAFVLDATDPKKRTNLDDYLKDNASDFLPALQVAAKEGAGEGDAGRKWVKTGGGEGQGNGGGNSLLQKARQNMDQAAQQPSVLNPGAPAQTQTGAATQTGGGGSGRI